MEEIEIELDELDDDVIEMIRQAADKEGRTFEEQAGIMIRAALIEAINRATSDGQTGPSGEAPTGP
jgi:hypothetical protein